MAIPVISTTTSILALVKGRAFTFQPAATNTPTSWAIIAGALPSGLTLSSTTGRISGVPEAEGVFVADLRATNGSGNSTSLSLAFGVEIIPFESDSALQIDIDLATGFVTNPRSSEDVPLYLKSADRVVLSVGFTRDGILQDIPGLAMINVGLKEFEPEALVLLNDGAVQKTGDYETTRYNVVLDLLHPDVAASLQAIFSNREDDQQTAFYAPTEIEWFVNAEVFTGAGPQILNRTSRTFLSIIARELIPLDAVDEVVV